MRIFLPQYKGGGTLSRQLPIGKELRAGIKTYIRFYNTDRPHRTLRYMTPLKFEEEYARYHPKQIEQDGSDFDVF